MKKALAGMLAGAMVLSALTGCSGGKQETAATAAGTETTAAAEAKAGDGKGADSGEIKTLDVVWFSDGKEGESFMKLANEYMEQHPEIKIELIEVPYADVDNKLKNMINAGQQPALARMTNLGVVQNQLIDLNQYVSDPEAFKNNFGSGLRTDFDGKFLAAPMDVTANGIIYNKTAFEKAGVAVPQSEDEIWTWEEYEEALKKVMEGSDCKYGMVFDFSQQRFATLIYQAGGSLLKDDMTASNINSPETKRALEWFKKLHDDGIMPTSVWLGAENPNEMFRTGQVATHFAGSWMIANYKDQITDFEWGVTYLPKDATRATVPGGKWLGAFDGTGVEKEAAEFIEWISQPEQNARYCMENYYLSQVKGNESLDYDFGAEYFEIFSNELNATNDVPGKEYGYQAFINSIQTDMKNGISEVLAGNLSIDELIESIDALATESLAELNQ